MPDQRERLPYRTWAPFWTVGFVTGVAFSWGFANQGTIAGLAVMIILGLSGAPARAAHLIEVRFRTPPAVHEQVPGA